VGVAFFRKDVDGFTINTQSTVPFTALGINYNDLSTSQQQALTLRGGPNVATVTLTKPVNLNKLLIQGVELTWVQPLDFLVKGAGVLGQRHAAGAKLVDGPGRPRRRALELSTCRASTKATACRSA
jgi:hypothetical protein